MIPRPPRFTRTDTLFPDTTRFRSAIATARSYVARGYSVDLGLGQINSRNMGWLGLTWDTVFKQCANVEAAGRVLPSNFRSAKTGRTDRQSTRLNSQSLMRISYAVFCLKKKK